MNTFYSKPTIMFNILVKSVPYSKLTGSLLKRVEYYVWYIPNIYFERNLLQKENSRIKQRPVYACNCCSN